MNQRLKWTDSLQTLWQQRSPRERRWLALGAVGLVFLVPAWRWPGAPL